MSQNDIHETELPKIIEFVEIAQANMAKHHIVMGDEDHEMMFYNHLVSLSRRIISRHFVEGLDDSMFSEISEEAYSLALDVCQDLFIHGQCSINRFEIFLIATHLQLFLENKKGGKKHE